jgi:hypothetical protein
MSTGDIAKLYSIPKFFVRECLLRSGVKLRPIKEALGLVRYKFVEHSTGRTHVTPDSAKKTLSEKAFKRHESTRKGITLKPSGYIEITIGENKGRSVHDVIMEKKIGRRLLPNEIVHHKNGIRSDNSDDNLELMTKSEHSRLHAKERIRKGTNYDISKESRSGEQHHGTKLKEHQVIEIYNCDMRYKDIAQKYCVTIGCVKGIKSGRNWSYLNLKKCKALTA